MIIRTLIKTTTKTHYLLYRNRMVLLYPFTQGCIVPSLVENYQLSGQVSSKGGGDAKSSLNQLPFLKVGRAWAILYNKKTSSYVISWTYYNIHVQLHFTQNHHTKYSIRRRAISIYRKGYSAGTWFWNIIKIIYPAALRLLSSARTVWCNKYSYKMATRLHSWRN